MYAVDTTGMEKTIAALTASTKKFWIKPSGIIQKSCGTVCSGTKKGHTVAKTVGVEETSPRRPLFDFAERNPEIGAGGR